MRKLIKFILFIIDEVLVVIFLIFLLIYFGVSQLVIGVMVIILLAIIIFIAYIFLPQLKKPITGTEGMEGLHGISLETLDPTGKIKVRGELWNAESINGTIKKGDRVIVEKVNGLRLLVKKPKSD